VKKYFDQLRPMERRLVVGVGVILLVVLNWVFVWPHFGDWGKLHDQLDKAHLTLRNYQTMIAEKPALEKQVKQIENDSGYVPEEDQGINFIRTIQNQAIQSGVAIVNTSRQSTHTNDAFFIEQVQNITVSATDDQLVDFLYKLGSGASMVRVRDLELQPDQTRMHLSANIMLVASYQKTPPAQPATPAAPKPTAAAALGLKPGLPGLNVSTAKPK
jgi:Tfp pilus assembly protein PilO